MSKSHEGMAGLARTGALARLRVGSDRNDAPMLQRISSPTIGTLLSAPIELAGDWGRMIPRSAD